jgi:hypothetical protein
MCLSAGMVQAVSCATAGKRSIYSAEWGMT